MEIGSYLFDGIRGRVVPGTVGESSGEASVESLFLAMEISGRSHLVLLDDIKGHVQGTRHVSGIEKRPIGFQEGGDGSGKR